MIVCILHAPPRGKNTCAKLNAPGVHDSPRHVQPAGFHLLEEYNRRKHNHASVILSTYQYNTINTRMIVLLENHHTTTCRAAVLLLWVRARATCSVVVGGRQRLNGLASTVCTSGTHSTVVHGQQPKNDTHMTGHS